uniref:uncharacterized protein LOC120341172 n=1 Tax=Styela clava TaxID=7725 RepID=UPI00193ABE48|nr:uncharacterized protein LOC120341172 [Styela clava]
MLKPYVNDHRDDWDDHVPYLCMANRATVHESTQFTPNRLMLGREIDLPIDVMYGRPTQTPLHPCYTEYVEWFKDVTEESFVCARNHLNQAALRRERNFDVHVQPQKFEEGELVWYYYPLKKKKLSSPWQGPFTVRRCFPNHTYEIQWNPGDKTRVVHVDNLRPFIHEETQEPSAFLDDSPADSGEHTPEKPDSGEQTSEEANSAEHTPGEADLQPCEEIIPWYELPNPEGQTLRMSKRERRQPAYFKDFV